MTAHFIVTTDISMYPKNAGNTHRFKTLKSIGSFIARLTIKKNKTKVIATKPMCLDISSISINLGLEIVEQRINPNNKM